MQVLNREKFYRFFETMAKELEFSSIGLLLIQKDKLVHFTFEKFWFVFNKSGVQKLFSDS
jgi:hypothetical protein